MPADEWQAIKIWQHRGAYRLGRIGERQYWLFKNRDYWEDEHLNRDEVTALLVLRLDRDAANIQRAQDSATARSPAQTKTRRTEIPQDVKHIVRQRDEGRCRICHARSDLQYDHIIPLAMNGGNTVENLQFCATERSETGGSETRPNAERCRANCIGRLIGQRVATPALRCGRSSPKSPRPLLRFPPLQWRKGSLVGLASCAEWRSRV
jgi:hypothetical protein